MSIENIVISCDICLKKIDPKSFSRSEPAIRHLFTSIDGTDVGIKMSVFLEDRDGGKSRPLDLCPKCLLRFLNGATKLLKEDIEDTEAEKKLSSVTIKNRNLSFTAPVTKRSTLLYKSRGPGPGWSTSAENCEEAMAMLFDEKLIEAYHSEDRVTWDYRISEIFGRSPSEHQMWCFNTIAITELPRNRKLAVEYKDGKESIVALD